MAYGKYKDLTKRIQSYKVLRDKAFKTASNPKHNGYERSFASMFNKFFDKKTSSAAIKNEIKKNPQLANEFHKPVTRKLKKEKCILLLKTIFGVMI